MEQRYETWWQRFLVFQLPLALVTIVALFPLVWMVVASLKGDKELYDVKAIPFLVSEPTLSHYKYLLENTLYPKWVLNSALTTLVAVSWSLFASVLAGYALARLKFPGVKPLGFVIFVTYLIPGTLMFLSMTRVMMGFHLIDTRQVLMVTYPTFLIPFCTWYLMGYFSTIPKEIEEAARIDGASRLTTLTRVVLPLVSPGILSAGIFAITYSWNEFLYSLIFVSDVNLRTIPVGVVTNLVRGDQFFWGELMAAAVLGSLPVVMLYMLFVDRIVPGLTAGSVKG